MFLFFNPREDFLLQLPKGGTVAEIGVASGDFSDQILDRSSPEKLHLIDPWIYQKDDDYQKDPNNLQNVQAQDIFLSVSKNKSSGIKFRYTALFQQTLPINFPMHILTGFISTACTHATPYWKTCGRIGQN